MNNYTKGKTTTRKNVLKKLTGRKPETWFARFRKILRWLGITFGVLFVLLMLVFIGIQTWPAFGAQGADFLRGVIGDKAVAGLEMDFNQAQDTIQKIKYQFGLDKPVAPWTLPQTSLPTLVPIITPTESATVTTAIQTPEAFQTTTPVEINPPEPTFTPKPSSWPPVNLISPGTAPGAGVWSAYIQDSQGYTVAYRTFLQPDPTRPYTIVAVVAIDLTRTRLHFVLGTIEPASPIDTPNAAARSGAIPAPDRVANVLLAAFNGGFKARHGEFGAMAAGITALPPKDGLGTLAIYQSGRVSLGEWGTGMTLTPDMVAFRQNGPLVIQLGKINPRIYDNSPQDWGYTVKDVSPTVRSGIGLSTDEKTLFYFCGPSLSMQALAQAMQVAGAWNAIQLDINNYWTLFVKFQPSGSKVIPEPLLPQLMVANVDRYLWNYSRDYFYITSTIK
ncbi:MAG: phosphodiester glycosidase family protein [Anaerolineales bacterium]